MNNPTQKVLNGLIAVLVLVALGLGYFVFQQNKKSTTVDQNAGRTSTTSAILQTAPSAMDCLAEKRTALGIDPATATPQQLADRTNALRCLTGVVKSVDLTECKAAPALFSVPYEHTLKLNNTGQSPTTVVSRSDDGKDVQTFTIDNGASVTVSFKGTLAAGASTPYQIMCKKGSGEIATARFLVSNNAEPTK